MKLSLNELLHRSMQLEGERFKLYRKFDKCRSIYEFPLIRKEIEELTLQIDQYENIIKAMRKLSKAKGRQ